MLKRILAKPIRLAEYSIISLFFCKIKNNDKELKAVAELVGAKIDKTTAKRYGEKRSEKTQCLLIQIIIAFCNYLVEYLMTDMPEKYKDEVKLKRREV